MSIRPQQQASRIAGIVFLVAVIASASIGGVLAYQYFSSNQQPAGVEFENPTSENQGTVFEVEHEEPASTGSLMTPTMANPMIYTEGSGTQSPVTVVEITFTQIPGASAYRIYRSTSSFSSPGQATQVAYISDCRLHQTLGPGDYYYAVVAYNIDSGETSSMSNVVVAQVRAIPLGKPTLVFINMQFQEHVQAGGFLDTNTETVNMIVNPGVAGATRYDLYSSSSPITDVSPNRATYVGYVEVGQTTVTISNVFVDQNSAEVTHYVVYFVVVAIDTTGARMQSEISNNVCASFYL